MRLFAIFQKTVRMKRLSLFSSVALLLLCLAANQTSLAQVPDADLEKAMNEAKVLGPNYSVTVKSQGKELDISTYLNSQSKDMEKDCKIDAVLLAKKAFDLDKQLVRAKISFYRYDRKSYREVSVTTGDVKAFGTGQTSNQELVDSLIVKESAVISDNGQAANAPEQNKAENADNKSINNDNGSSKSANEKNADAKHSQGNKPAIASTSGVTRANGDTTASTLPGCAAGELTFYYPKNWALKTNLKQDPGGERKVAQLICTSAKDDAYIMLRTHPEDTPEQQMNDDVRYWMTHRYKTQSPRQVIPFGKGGKYQGYNIVVYDKEGDRITAERHLYFWTPLRKVYSFELNCNRDEFEKLNKDLNVILSTSQFRAVK